MLLESGSHGVGKFIGGDARISTNIEGHFATSHNATNIIDRERTDTSYGGGGGGGGGKKKSGGGNGSQPAPSAPAPPARTPFVRPGQPLTKNVGKKGQELCIGFNTGQCPGNGVKCPSNPLRVHHCSWCLGNHPATKCDPSKKGSGKKKQGGKKQQ